MILENGVIRTMEPSLPLARGLAIAGERIAGGVGPHEAALPSPEVVNLGGRCVLPGFADAHVHFLQWALVQRQVRLEGTQSLQEAVARVAEAARAAPPDRWVRGRGWRAGDWRPPVEPTKEALDAACGARPVALMAHDGHSLWVSSAALAVAQGDLDCPGGLVERDERGEPTGILREQAAWRFWQRHVLASVSEQEWEEALRAALKVAAARGLTAIHDKDGSLGALARFQRLHEQGALTLRVWQSLPHEQLDSIARLGLRPGLGDGHLRLGYLKVFMDGTLGSGTARMLDGSGVEITSRAELEEIVRRAASVGWPVAVHAIGDQANRDALDAFERTQEAWRPQGLRQRIEHAQCLAPEDIPRFAALGIAASVQFSHAPSDQDLAERLWAGRLEGAYAYRALVESGALVANGSDAPVEELDPLAGLRAAVLRTLDERPPWRPEQALTVEQALYAATVAPAWLSGDERRRGKLLPGYLADLVVLDRDPLSCPLEELAEIEVVATMVGGRWVFNPPPWD